MSGNYHPTPPPAQPPRSPWSSPVVIGAIVAGVLILALAVLLGFLLIPSDDDNQDAVSSGSSATTTRQSIQTVTVGPSTVTSTVTPTTTSANTTATTTSTPTTQRPQPDVPGTDSRGFVAGPRCNAPEDPLVMVGQTNRSKIIICQVGNQSGRYYYKGLADGMSAEIGYPTRSGDQFVAMKDGTTYTMTPAALTISKDGNVLTTESMIFYWTN